MHRLLRWLVDAPLADAIVGDLGEERARRVRRDGSVRAAAWHWMAMAGLGGHMLVHRMLSGAHDLARGLMPGRRRGTLRQAARSLRRSPWYAVTVPAIVALSIMIAVTAFAVVDGVLFKKLPYPEPQELYALAGVFDGDAPEPDRIVNLVSPRELHAWQQLAPDLDATLLGSSSIQLEDGSIVDAMSVGQDFFDVFGVRTLIGGFSDEDYAGTAEYSAVVISHRLWERRYNADPAIVGHVIRTPSQRLPTPPPFAGRPRRIVGVLAAESFVPPFPGAGEQWVRLENRIDALFPYTNGPEFGERIGIAFARVPATEMASVSGALLAAVASYKAAQPPPDAFAVSRGFGPYDRVEFVPIDHVLTSRERPVLALVFFTALGLTCLVLLNAGALGAARSQRRLRELALRRSLGAGPVDLLRDALAEQAWLVGIGAVVGLTLSPALVHVVGGLLPPGLNLIKELQVDWRAAAFATLLSAAMAPVVAALGVRRVVRGASPSVVIGSGPSRASAPALVGQWFVAGQIALAFAIVAGGVMFVTSLGLVASEDPGIRTEHTVALQVRFAESHTGVELERYIDRIRSSPGVTAAGVYDRPLFHNYRPRSATFLEPSGEPMRDPLPSLLRVGPGFFEAAGVELLEGRLPTDAELAADAPVLAVSASFAARFWPGGQAVGQNLPFRFARPHPTSTVVGVVRDVRFAALDTPEDGAAFTPRGITQSGTFGTNVFVAFGADPAPLIPGLLDSLSDLDPDSRVPEVELLSDALALSVSPRRISALTAAAFALCALVLVAVGLFGLVGQSVAWRAREMGIRIALGSTASGVVRLIVRQQLTAVVVGLTGGLVLIAGSARFVESYLYELSAYDPRLWIGAAMVVLATAMLAAWIPAMRASRVDPAVVLRND